MRAVCAWCGEELGPRGSDVDGERAVSHGLCERCSHHLFAQQGMPLLPYLDGLGAPVVVVDAEGTIRAANRQVRELVQQDLSSIEGRKGGDVFECAHARLSEGCGQTIHCSACAIRRTVMETHRTGRSREGVPASLQAGTPGNARRSELLISTERVGDYVFLRIDALDGRQLLE
jgi:PAS domain-containing protein